MSNDCLLLNKKLYSSEAINITVRAFDNICDTIVNETEGYYSCSFKHFEVDRQLLMKEFENYLIGISEKYGL